MCCKTGFYDHGAREGAEPDRSGTIPVGPVPVEQAHLHWVIVWANWVATHPAWWL